MNEKEVFKKNKQPKPADMNQMVHGFNKSRMELLQSSNGSVLPTPAYGYDLHIGELHSDIVIGLETGHVFSIEHKFPQPVRYSIRAHGTKVLKLEYCQFDHDILATLSADKTFALWHTSVTTPDVSTAFGKVIEAPVLRVQCNHAPNTFLTLPNNQILVGDVTNSLKVFTF